MGKGDEALGLFLSFLAEEIWVLVMEVYSFRGVVVRIVFFE